MVGRKRIKCPCGRDSFMVYVRKSNKRYHSLNLRYCPHCDKFYEVVMVYKTIETPTLKPLAVPKKPLENVQVKPKVKRKKWTDRQTMILLDLIDRGYTRKHIADRFNRSVQSIHSKLDRIKHSSKTWK